MENSKGYDLPNLESVETPQQASETINKIMADAFGDPAHPWFDGNSPQHRDFVRVVGELHEIRTRDEGALTDLEKGLQAAVDGMDERQAVQFAQAQAVMDDLVAEGFPRHSLRQDITKYELSLLRLRLQVARGEYDSVLPEIEQELYKLNAPPEHHQTLQALRTLPGTMTEAKEQLAETLLFFIQDEKRKKFGRLNMP